MGVDSNSVVTIVLAGGQGTRLFPLTLHHSKPAVSFGGRYRLIDIPISNALHSHFRQIFIMAQVLPEELQHHIQHTYSSQNSSVALLTPQDNWYEGTADAVRKNLPTLEQTAADYFLILSGDHLYNIDFRAMVDFAAHTQADLTIASLPVSESEARRYGILTTSATRITHFVEKPPHPKGPCLASMGIYVFKRQYLFDLLRRDPRHDFGQHLIPLAVAEGNTHAFLYDGYWEDIGTISSYHKANLLLTESKSRLQLYDEDRPIYTRPTFLPGPQLGKVALHGSILCEGATVESGTIDRSIIGLRTRIGKNVCIRDSILIGNPSRIGDNCILENVILDERVTLGNGVKLINHEGRYQYDGENLFIREGILIVPAGTQLPDHFEL